MMYSNIGLSYHETVPLMIDLQALEHQGLGSSDGSVLVTGATGGVGSVAILLLAHLGYHVSHLHTHSENLVLWIRLYYRWIRIHHLNRIQNFSSSSFLKTKKNSFNFLCLFFFFPFLVRLRRFKFK